VKLSLGGLSNLLQGHVAEVRFRRRTPGTSMFRRMLCTNDLKLLLSVSGKVALNYRRPTQYPAYNPTAYNLLCVWDIFMQDFRMIPVDAVDVISIIPTNPPDNFWNYFNEKLARMTTAEKLSFMQN
jgi:hypothetical protein